MTARSLMVAGTASHVGKSWVTTAICRHLRRRGLRVAPFKAQNMSNNSYPCRGGGEIGRAQVAQAEACGLEPEPDMNPVLLKPNSAQGSQVVVDGRVWRTLAAREYYEHFDFLLERVLAAHARLAARFDVVVCEGAGSVTELNLKQRDLVNFGLARRIKAPVLLVADIDRGGVFASLVGTLCLLDDEERALLRSFAINRFRGDPTLFDDGRAMLEQRLNRPCLGVLPYVDDIEIDAEDSVSLEGFGRGSNGAGPRVAILRLPRVSNFTDFRLLPDAEWIRRPVAAQFDLVILPGTKNTIGDLRWLSEQGLDEWVRQQHAAGAKVLGVCGGYQMLGTRIDDPHGVETERESAAGLGLLPVETVLAPEKTTRVVRAALPDGHSFPAYEIHMGVTNHVRPCSPFALLPDGPEGACAERCAGTYLHGALEDHGVLSRLLGCEVPRPESKEQQYDRLANWFERHADIARFEELYL